MATEILITTVSEEPDGMFSVHLRAVDTVAQKVIGQYVVQAANATDFKDKLRPKLQAYVAAEARRQQLLSAANTALDELKAELGL